MNHQLREESSDQRNWKLFTSYFCSRSIWKLCQGSGPAEAGISSVKIKIQKGQDLITNITHPVKTEVHSKQGGDGWKQNPWVFQLTVSNQRGFCKLSSDFYKQRPCTRRLSKHYILLLSNLTMLRCCPKLSLMGYDVSKPTRWRPLQQLLLPVRRPTHQGGSGDSACPTTHSGCKKKNSLTSCQEKAHTSDM